MKTQEAADFFGSKYKLAQLLGIKAQSINNWKEYPPLDRQFAIKELSKGKLKVTPPNQQHTQDEDS